MESVRVTRILGFHIVFVALVILLIPTGSMEFLDVDGAIIPVYRWVRGINGGASFLKDAFIVIWISSPIWMVMAGIEYRQSTRGERYRAPVIVFNWILVLLVVAIVFIPNYIFSSSGYWRSGLFALAAKNRLAAFMIFPIIMIFVNTLIYAAFVKIPIDFARSIIPGRKY